MRKSQEKIVKGAKLCRPTVVCEVSPQLLGSNSASFARYRRGQGNKHWTLEIGVSLQDEVHAEDR